MPERAIIFRVFVRSFRLPMLVAIGKSIVVVQAIANVRILIVIRTACTFSRI